MFKKQSSAIINFKKLNKLRLSEQKSLLHQKYIPNELFRDLETVNLYDLN